MKIVKRFIMKEETSYNSVKPLAILDSITSTKKSKCFQQKFLVYFH